MRAASLVCLLLAVCSTSIVTSVVLIGAGALLAWRSGLFEAY